MLKLKTEDNQQLSVYFRYPDEDTSVCHVDISPDGKTWNHVVEAKVRRHFADANNRKVGRKEAFKRAVETLTVDKESRQILWNAFMAPAESKGTIVPNIK